MPRHLRFSYRHLTAVAFSSTAVLLAGCLFANGGTVDQDAGRDTANADVGREGDASDMRIARSDGGASDIGGDMAVGRDMANGCSDPSCWGDSTVRFDQAEIALGSDVELPTVKLTNVETCTDPMVDSTDPDVATGQLVDTELHLVRGGSYGRAYIRVKCGSEWGFVTVTLYPVTDGRKNDLRVWLRADTGVQVRDGRVQSWENLGLAGGHFVPLSEEVSITRSKNGDRAVLVFGSGGLIFDDPDNRITLATNVGPIYLVASVPDGASNAGPVLAGGPEEPGLEQLHLPRPGSSDGLAWSSELGRLTGSAPDPAPHNTELEVFATTWGFVDQKFFTTAEFDLDLEPAAMGSSTDFPTDVQYEPYVFDVIGGPTANPWVGSIAEIIVFTGFMPLNEDAEYSAVGRRYLRTRYPEP
jgi:hypothetical protein